jgi:hypothetical protein
VAGHWEPPPPASDTILGGENACRLLEEVDLRSCCIQATGAVALAQALAMKPTMKLLALNGNAVSDDGVAEVRPNC